MRGSTRSNKDVCTSTDYINEVVLSSVLDNTKSSQEQHLAYLAELSTGIDSKIVDCMDARIYLSKSKLRDPDQPSFHEAMHGKDSEF